MCERERVCVWCEVLMYACMHALMYVYLGQPACWSSSRYVCPNAQYSHAQTIPSLTHVTTGHMDNICGYKGQKTEMTSDKLFLTKKIIKERYRTGDQVWYAVFKVMRFSQYDAMLELRDVS